MESPYVLHQRGIAAALLTIMTLTPTALLAQQPAKLTNADQSLEQIPALVTSVPVSREINANEVHSYRITLAVGQYARLVIDQRGVDVVVRVVGPTGRQLAEVDNPNGDRGPELVSVVAEENGTYQVEIRPLKKDAHGNYEVRIDELRVATVQDRSLVAAHAAFAEGERARSQKRTQEAIEKYEEALELYRAAADRTGEIATLNIVAGGYKATDEKQKALDYYEQVLQLYESMGNRAGQADALHSIGAVYNSPDQHSVPGIIERHKALEFFNRAVALYKEVNDPKREAYTLSEIGGIYNAFGERQRALQCFNQALQIQRTIGDQRAEGYTLAYIGGAYDALGEKRKALEYFSQAVPLFKATRDRFGEASIFTKLGGVHFSLGESDKALENLDKALPLHKAVGNRNWEASTLTQLGAVYYSRGDAQKALEYLNQALPLQKALHNRGWEAHTLTYMGAIYSSLGDWTRAMEHFNQALKLSRVVMDRNGEANILLNIARAERNRNNLTNARQHTETALEIIESLRTRITSQEWRASYLAAKRDYYEFYIDLLMRLHQEAPSKGYDAAALQASERARARSLLETLTEARFDIREGVDPQLLEREHELQKQINDKDIERLRLLGGKPTEEQTQKIEKELHALLTDYSEVRAQIRARSPRYAALMQPEPLTLREIQQQILDADTLLLEYALGEEKSYLWAVTQTDLMSFVLPKRAVVESSARRVYELLTSSHKIAARRASEMAAIELSRMVLGPAAALLKKKRLVVVSEGALQYVPFAALSIPEQQQSYEPLINRYEVINLPSASVLAVLRREMAGRQVAPKAVAVLADAVFQSDDARLQQLQRNAMHGSVVKTDDQLSDQNDLMRSARESGLSNFQRLPFTRHEAEAIVSEAGESKSLKALDFDASRDTVLNLKLDQYRIIHFATHGLLNSQHPELSGIVLSLVDKNGRPRDGFLRTHDIYNLRLRANLVVLSACRTALGNEVKGEGLLGLTRGFMYSGAPRVVASLWDVKDEATAKLMKHFYQKMLREGLRPAAALRAAQVLLLKEPQWTAPYYWAGFTLQGDWR